MTAPCSLVFVSILFCHAIFVASQINCFRRLVSLLSPFRAFFFLFPAVMGMGFSWIIGYELRCSRIHDKLRLRIIRWFQPNLHSSTSASSPSPGISFSVLNYVSEQRRQGDVKSKTDNMHFLATLISTDISLTSSLWVTTITIPPQHWLTTKNASGLEVYYVLCGSGEWGSADGKQKGSAEAKPIHQGEALIVKPQCPRWFGNPVNTSDLVLLRASDAGNLHRTLHYDQVVPVSSTDGRATTAANRLGSALTFGIKQVGDHFSLLWKEGKGNDAVASG